MRLIATLEPTIGDNPNSSASDSVTLPMPNIGVAHDSNQTQGKYEKALVDCHKAEKVFVGVYGHEHPLQHTNAKTHAHTHPHAKTHAHTHKSKGSEGKARCRPVGPRPCDLSFNFRSWSATVAA